MTEKYETIVAGLGAVGSAALYQLAKAGNAVLGIDRFNPPHTLGSSHGDTRITRLAVGEGIHLSPLVLRSHEIWREIERETGREILVRTGGLILSGGANNRRARGEIVRRPDFIENTIEAAKKYHIEHELLSAPQIRERFPQFDVKDHETGYYEQEAGFVRPEEAIRAQLELARRYGAEVHTDEAVESFAETANGVTVKTDLGTYIAGKLILTVGAWLPQLIESKFGGYFQVMRQVLYWFAPKDSIRPYLRGNCPVFIWELPGDNRIVYGFPALDENGGVKIATEQYETTTTSETVDRVVSEGETEAMYENFVEPYLPGLSDRCVNAVVCLYTVTPDSGFVIDKHPDHENVVLASPCSGHGFKHSAAIGEVLMQLATRGQSEIDISPFSFRRFS